jgi:hypothetical protein
VQALGGAGGRGLVHPEGPFGLRHQNLGLRVGEAAVLEPQAEHVVEVEVAHHHGVDRGALDPGRGEAPQRPACAGGSVIGKSRIHEDPVPVRLDEERREGDVEMVRRQEGPRHRLAYRLDRRVRDEAGLQRPGQRPLVQGGQRRVAAR